MKKQRDFTACLNDYFGINAAVVWKTAKEELPKIKEKIQKLINDIKQD